MLKYTIRLVLLGLNPIVLIGAFWFVQLTDKSLIYLPILGVCTLMLGGALGIAAAKTLKMNRAQTGSMFVTGAFINIGSFGTLFCFLFFGEASLAYAALFRLFEELIYYTVAFPIARAYGETVKTEEKKTAAMKILTDPFIMITFSAIVIGGCLNMSGWNRPEFYGTLNAVLVPLSSFLLVVPVGFAMKFKSVRGYLKESFIVSTIKFFFVPLTITTIAYFAGVGNLHNGMVLGVVLILSSMPPAVTSLLPPQLFKLDVDLANSSWLINTGLLIVVLPLLYVIVNLF
ncbi:AEC family transporter [Bacillus solitudinis]|uniref:AEC family transporter n=1 Tax=Bacillus solitudinis TaxID=2014074 RepID=UPI0012FE2B81|nr:hypothetical protein [Bacillus solitudinis]